MEKLSYSLLERRGYSGFLLKDAPERVLQFGEGAFLRAFAEDFIDRMNETAGFNGKVVLVQPRGGHPDTCTRFAEQDGLYTLLLRGREKGEAVSQRRIISCVSRCLDPKGDWQSVLDCAQNPDLRFIISNTTEAGIVFDPACKAEDAPPSSFPGKLTRFLHTRWRLGLPIQVVDDHVPYKQRKVRILNGAHTSMVLAAHLAGFKIVRDCMEDETVRGFMNRTISQEIIPTLDLPRSDLEDFASAVADRFNNPFIDHALLSIALNSTAKWKARVMPSLLEYAARKGALPPCITFSFAAYIAFYRDCPAQDDPWVLEFYQARKGDSPAQLVHAVIHNERMWGSELAALEGFEEAVTAALERIDRLGAYEAMKECLA